MVPAAYNGGMRQHAKQGSSPPADCVLRFKRFPSIQYEVVEIAKGFVAWNWSKLFTMASVQSTNEERRVEMGSMSQLF